MYNMIITLLIIATLAVLAHKSLMNAVDNYNYDNTVDKYEDRVGKMYWDIIHKRQYN